MRRRQPGTRTGRAGDSREAFGCQLLEQGLIRDVSLLRLCLQRDKQLRLDAEGDRLRTGPWSGQDALGWPLHPIEGVIAELVLSPEGRFFCLILKDREVTEV